MRVKPIQELVQRMLYDRQTKLNAEIQELKKRQKDDEGYFGCGGAYNRKETAIQIREEQLKELDAYRRGQNNVIITDMKTLYQFNCPSCFSHFYTESEARKEHAECPLCEHLVYSKGDKQQLEIVRKQKPQWQQEIENQQEGGQ